MISYFSHFCKFVVVIKSNVLDVENIGRCFDLARVFNPDALLGILHTFFLALQKL